MQIGATAPQNSYDIAPRHVATVTFSPRRLGHLIGDLLANGRPLTPLRLDPLWSQRRPCDRESRFLMGSWQALVSRTWPLLTERVVRTFGGAAFRPSDLLGPNPLSV